MVDSYFLKQKRTGAFNKDEQQNSTKIEQQQISTMRHQQPKFTNKLNNLSFEIDNDFFKQELIPGVNEIVDTIDTVSTVQ